VIWGLTVVLLGVSASLGIRNGSLSEDPAFAVLAIVMMVGNVSVGAFVASRIPTNPTGWLLMTIGIGFLIGIGTSEYAVYALFTNPGGLPHPYAAAWISNGTPLIAAGAALLLVACSPTGRRRPPGGDGSRRPS
jgi:hypothetical protein